MLEENTTEKEEKCEIPLSRDNVKETEGRYFFKDEIERTFEEEKNKCIRSILWTVEVVIPDKRSNEFQKMRKCVLDSVNDLSRRIQSKIDELI